MNVSEREGRLDRGHRRTCRRVLAILAVAIGSASSVLSSASHGGTSQLIAFAALTGKHTDIYVGRTDGTGRVRLTRGGNDEYCPTWSPDGGSVALVIQEPSTSPITGRAWIAVTSNSGRRRWQIEADGGCPAWSPDGRWLAYFQRTDSGIDLNVVAANGRGMRRLAAHVDPRLLEGVPAWSPGSQEIAFMNEGDNERFLIRFVGVNRARRPPLKVRRDPSFCSDGCQLYAARMSWAPGNDIAFLIAGGDLYPEVLYAVGRDGGSQRLLSGELQDIYAPAWAADGKRLAFVARKGTNDQIWTANADGTGLRQVTTIRSNTSNLSGVFDPTWSPDGNRLACWGHAGGIYIVEARSGKAVLVVGNAVGAASWRP